MKQFDEQSVPQTTSTMEVREKNRLNANASCIARLKRQIVLLETCQEQTASDLVQSHSSTGNGCGNGDSQYANPVTWYQEDEDTVDRWNGYLKQSLLLRLGSRVTQLETC
jgi:hypothetical protein